MGKKGPLWWRESDWGSSAANQILLRHSGPILSSVTVASDRLKTSLFTIRQGQSKSNQSFTKPPVFCVFQVF